MRESWTPQRILLAIGLVLLAAAAWLVFDSRAAARRGATGEVQ